MPGQVRDAGQMVVIEEYLGKEGDVFFFSPEKKIGVLLRPSGVRYSYQIDSYLHIETRLGMLTLSCTSEIPEAWFSGYYYVSHYDYKKAAEMFLECINLYGELCPTKK